MAPVPNQFANETTPLELVKLDQNFAAFQSDTGSSLVGFNNGSLGSTTRTAEDKMREIVSAKDFGAIGDGIVDDWPAIQAAIDFVLAQKRGRLYLGTGTFKITQTLTVSASGPGALLIGDGADGIHDAGSPDAATTLLWAGAAGGTVIHFSSVSGAANSRMHGGGLENVKIKCQNTAGIGLLVTSVVKGNFKDIFVESPTISAFKITTLGNALLAEASDTQRCVFDRCTWRCIDFPATRAARGFWITSHQPILGTSNTSLNYFSQIGGQSWGGTGGGVGVFVEDGDNNTFMNPSLFRVGGTAVEGILLVGNSSCDENFFWNPSVGGANSIQIKGTASGFFRNPSKNSFWCVDTGNGTQYPTADVGVIFGWHGDYNIFVKQGFQQMVASDNLLSAISGVETLGSESLKIINGSDNHVRLEAGGNVWGISVGSAGDMRIIRLAGTGKLNLGNGAPVQIEAKDVTFGAADSGGTGFRVLRVPN